jgi:hypothetical protein
MDQQELERIARNALRELGAGGGLLSITPAEGADRWRISVGGATPFTLTIRAGRGTTPQFVREQIFEQFNAQ